MAVETHPVRIFIAYAHEDAPSRERLRIHLNVLQRRGLCHIFWDGLILPGERWDDRLKAELHRADIFLLLVSEHFLDSDYVHEVELPKALELRQQDKAEVLPVILRHCPWKYTELADFQCILHEGQPIEVSNGFAYVADLVAETSLRLKTQRGAGMPTAPDPAKETSTPKQPQKNADKSHQNRHNKISDDKKDNAPNDLFADLMIPVKGGVFDMGNSGNSMEKPVHLVTVPDFHLCKYPVTNAQWKAIMGKHPFEHSYYLDGDDLPVRNISWDAAQEFIKELNKKTGKKYRLPTEAEWEYAAKGGDRSHGYKYAGSNDLKEVGWFEENSGDKPLSPPWIGWISYERRRDNNCRCHPVGQKKPNELGLLDMSGNVEEWCADHWHENYKSAPNDGSAWTWGGDSSSRVFRGGSFFDDSYTCRTTSRAHLTDYFYSYLGFRLAL